MTKIFLLSFIFFQNLIVGFSFEGRLVPVNPIELRSPKYEIHGFGSASSSSSVSLKFKQDSGKRVKKGELIAEFKVSAHWMIPRAQRAVNLAKLKKREALQKHKGLIFEIENKIERAKISLEKLVIQLGARSVMAKQNLQRLQLNIRLQKILIKDLILDLDFQKNENLIKANYYQTKIEMVLSEEKHIYTQLNRFKTKSPIEGYLFFPHHKEYKRPIKVNDSIRCGSVCAYVSQTKSAALEFFVPERFLKQLKIGKKASVTLVKTQKNYKAIIVSWNPFLQILPVIKNDSSILNTYDKFILVRAKLIDEISSFSEGTEVDVRLKWIQEL
ncbi:MAG: hypothetical protein COB02_05165 [Candidatus Cloacimonadota bacterium]|nr:MAG: hypothetical protein COB02_05165 [Candidatus Cloacimonadota bacterium]